MEKGMKNDLSCAVVRDLLPSYIDKLTSEESAEAVERHLEECPDCGRVLEQMRGGGDREAELLAQQPEIDYLKKSRARNRKWIGLSVLLCLVVFLGAGINEKYFVSSRIRDVKLIDYTIVTAEEDHFIFRGELRDKSCGVADIGYEEQDGVLEITMKQTGASVFHENSFYGHYEPEGKLTQIRLNGFVIWDQGCVITQEVAAVYASRHPYIGNMPENGSTVTALGLVETLGNFKNELQTTTPPYGWTLLLERDYSAGSRELLEEKMQSYAYVMIAVIDNLHHVTFFYTVDGTECSLTFTEEEADEALGQPVKELAKSPGKLQLLMQGLGLAEGRIY